MTKKENFATLIDIVNGSDYEDKSDMVDFLNHEIELLSRKSSKTGETKTQKENKEVKNTIYDALVAVGNPVTVSELQASDEHMAQYSNQKLSTMLRQMVEDGRVVKTSDKKKSYFAAV